jgi:hypothetical protein
MVFNATFNNISVISVVAVSFIGGVISIELCMKRDLYGCLKGE